MAHFQGENMDFIGPRDQPHRNQRQKKTEQIMHLFDKLHLKGRNHKLRVADVLQITEHSLQSHDFCGEEELVQTFLQKLLMMNYRARYIKTKETNEQHCKQQKDNNSSQDEGDIFDDVSSSNKVTSKSDPVHPMDVQMAVFHCADSFLKQLIVTKLSQCQFALPLLVPHPFTQQIEFPIWTFRQINKSWKMRNTNNEIISKVQPVYKAKTPMVSFFRFGSVSSSKSQLMNNLINEKHNTFFHRNCPGSSRTRLLMDGVVEIAWFYPSGKDTDTFTDCVAFCNLHGDAGDNEKQLQILTEMSSVNVVLLSQIDKKDKNAIKIQNLYKDKKPLVCLLAEDESGVIEMRNGKYKIGLKDRNQSDVSEELKRAINDCLSSSASASMFRLEDVSKHSDIRVDEEYVSKHSDIKVDEEYVSKHTDIKVDEESVFKRSDIKIDEEYVFKGVSKHSDSKRDEEDDEDCMRGRDAAQQMSLLENKNLREIKESFLPCQGELWNQLCQKKQLNRPQGEDIEQEISRKQTEKKNIREMQNQPQTSVTEMRKGKNKIGLKDRNQSDVTEELRRARNDCLSSSASASMFRLEDVSKHSDIRVDEEYVLKRSDIKIDEEYVFKGVSKHSDSKRDEEDDEDCMRGRDAAQQISLLENKNLREIKELLLPCQGELWHQCCQKNKELHRPQGEETEQEISRKQTEKRNIQEMQNQPQTSVTEMRKGKNKIGLKDRNQSDVTEELRRARNDCLSSSASASMFRLEDVSKHSDIKVDKEYVFKHSNIKVDEEDDEDCRRGRETAQKMMSLLEKKDLTEIKESFLPRQGKLWHQWCQKNKELHRLHEDDIEQEISTKKTEIKNIREMQNQFQTSEFIKFFIKQLNSDDANKMFFLNWLRIFLDEFTSADLSAIHHKYHKKWTTVLKLKNKNKSEQLKAEQTELEKISVELQAATFGLEHIMREIGQIYESCSSVKKNKTDLQLNFSSLPSLAAEMMIFGFPLELMDGDAAHVPLIWITAVLDELIQKLGDQRVFVLSVLGLQSSGKSTMLNAMFGLQFAVSAGRCTRGAFMQLIRVSEEMKDQMKFDYILVVDTEGLCALELAGRSTRHHDNELATFVVGLTNLTIINIFGENLSEMQDILQIVVQAFLRMKEVKLNPNCIFVHQNVSDVTAGEKNMEGRRRLQEKLDEMTKLAAEDEVCDAECFNDVINFDVQNDVKYFAQLWEGSPPMAPPNPNYCENIQELKKTIISKSSKSDGMRLTHLRERIKDLWEALLNERFVFSFRNSLEISVYRRLETEYSKWTWTLRSAMMEIQIKLQNKIENEAIHEIEDTDLHRELMDKSEEVKKSMSKFFEKDTDKDILIQWKTSFEQKIKEFEKSIVRLTKKRLNDILQQQELKNKNDALKSRYQNTVLGKIKKCVENLKMKYVKHKDISDITEKLKKEFDLFWAQCVEEKTKHTPPPIKDIDILTDVKEILSGIYTSLTANTCNDNSSVFNILSYSNYVHLKKSRGLRGPVKSETKSLDSCSGLSKEDETQITNLISDVAQQIDTMIQSHNISEMGYNINCIEELIYHIKRRIKEYEEKSDVYVFKNEFFMDLVISIFKRAEKTIADQHRMFREANDPVLYLEKKRDEYYSIFLKYYNGATSAAIFGEIICQKMKEPIKQSVYKQTARDLADEIRSNCPSLNGNRSNLEKHILKKLAEEENFDKYINYIHNPKDHFKSFIRDEVHQYIRDKFSMRVKPKMNHNTKVLQQKILTAARESTEYVQVKSGDVDLWLRFFTQKLSGVLIFSVKDFRGVKHDDVDDFKLLENVIKQEVRSIMSKIHSKLTTSFTENLAPKFRPHTILTDHFCQCCWVQCPFCKAICINTIEDHDGDHSVPFHRVIGLNGWYNAGTTTLCIKICTSSVASNEHFIPNNSDFVPWRKYRTAGGVYAKWSITPDHSELSYWKWFACRFQKDLERHYKKTFQSYGIIQEWKYITKQDALHSLQKKFK